MSDTAFEATCKTYTKVLDIIATYYGVPMPDRCGRQLADCVRELVATVVREQCRVAAEEAAREAFKLAAANMPGQLDVPLYVPPSEIRIAAGNVGRVRLESFLGFAPLARRGA